MKVLRNYLLLLVCCMVAATAFTSCLDSNDDSTIDAATYKSYLNSISGTYYGRTVFYKAPDNSSSMVKYDSVSTSVWKASIDSTITIYDFPISKLDSAVNVTSSSPDNVKQLFEAIKACPTTTLKAFYGIPNANYVTSTYISFIVNPVSIKLNLNYGGSDHTVYLVFTTGAYAGYWISSTKKTVFQMVLSSIYVDSTTSPLSSSYTKYIGVVCTSE